MQQLLSNFNSCKPTRKPVRGLFSSENCCNFRSRHLLEVQWGSFYAEFSAAQNKANFTSLGCLAQKLEHLLKIARSVIWRCFVPLLRLCSFFLPHHLMEIAIKLEPDMLQKAAWAHLNCVHPRTLRQPEDTESAGMPSNN